MNPGSINKLNKHSPQKNLKTLNIFHFIPWERVLINIKMTEENQDSSVKGVEFRTDVSHKGFQELVAFVTGKDSCGFFEIAGGTIGSGSPPRYSGVTVKYVPEEKWREVGRKVGEATRVSIEASVDLEPANREEWLKVFKRLRVQGFGDFYLRDKFIIVKTPFINNPNRAEFMRKDNTWAKRLAGESGLTKWLRWTHRHEQNKFLEIMCDIHFGTEPIWHAKWHKAQLKVPAGDTGHRSPTIEQCMVFCHGRWVMQVQGTVEPGTERWDIKEPLEVREHRLR